MSAERTIAVTRAALVAMGVAIMLAAGWGSPPWWAIPALVVATAAAERASVRLMFGKQAAAFTLNDAVMAIAFVLEPGGWIAVAVPLGYGLATVGRRPWAKLSFNMAQEFATVGAGVSVTLAVSGGVSGAVAGLVTFAVLNLLVVAIPIAATSRVPYHRVLGGIGLLGVLHNAGNISVGVLAGWLALHEPLGLLGLVVPVGLLWWSYEQQTRRASEARLFAELARGQEKLAGSTIDASAQVIVTAAARLFGGAEVEMLLRHPSGAIRYVGDEDGIGARLRSDAEAFDAPWVLRSLARGGVHTGTERERPYCSAVLGDPGRPIAVLIARRPARAGGFTRADIQLAEVLVGQAESWLSVAELSARHDVAVGRAEAYGAASRVLGDLGSETVPALAVLRESADRLSRLAATFDGPDPVSEIVAELHAVERAVASLLGAIALASDPRPAAGHVAHLNGSSPAVPGDMEWTTTGRLEDAVGR
jgi:hypothetical protein